VATLSGADVQQGRWLRAVCSDTVPPAVLGTATVVSPRCSGCVLAVAAACAASRRLDRPGVCVRLLRCWRRHRHNSQPTPWAQVPDITLSSPTAQPAEHELRTRSVAEPGCYTVPGLVVPSPVRHDSGAAR
jgi:hypothetical protein